MRFDGKKQIIDGFLGGRRPRPCEELKMKNDKSETRSLQSLIIIHFQLLLTLRKLRKKGKTKPPKRFCFIKTPRSKG
jgi:hypothetical protein